MKKYTLVPAGLLLFFFSLLAVADAPTPSDWKDELLPLIAVWQDTPSDSSEERRAEDVIKAFLSDRAPALDSALDAFWASPAGSAEESTALGTIRAAIDDATADPLLRIYEPDPTSVRPSLLPFDLIGAPTALPVTTVDLEIIAPPVVEAGEQITVYGKVHNRGAEPIWIVDTRTHLTVPVNIWGNTVESPTTLSAYFSTTPFMADEALRIDAGGSHTVSWLVDFAMIAERERQQRADERRQNLVAANAAGKDNADGGSNLRGIDEENDEGAFDRLFRRTSDTFFGFLLFRPDRYELVANMHVWAKPPLYNDSFRVTNLGDSASVSASTVIEVTPPQTVLMFGAMVGGIICYILRLAQSTQPIQVSKRMFAVELPSAMLLCVIGTIMLSRVGNTDFLISIKVQDFWGAIATGFVIQWLGLSWFMNRFKSGKEQQPADGSTVPKNDGEAPVPVKPQPAPSC